MKKSAGILVYKKENKDIKVLLCHMGGPYWQYIDNGGWSIPKGLYFYEKAIDGAIREFKEETSFSINKEDLIFLASKKVSRKKLVHIFITTNDYDCTKAFSNTFDLEWPKGSGIIKTFPEMDKAAWFTIEDAKEKIIKEQLFFIKRLEEYINNNISCL